MSLTLSGNGQISTLTGQVCFFAMATAPAGFIKCDGAAVSRTTYSDLFTAIGTTYGVGDGSTTFNLPDMRGEFPRGWDDGRGVDSARGIGTAQDATRHVRIVMASNGNYTGPDNTSPQDVDSTSGSVDRGFGGSPSGDGTNVVQYYTARPRNVALLACIKF